VLFVERFACECIFERVSVLVVVNQHAGQRQVIAAQAFEVTANHNDTAYDNDRPAEATTHLGRCLSFSCSSCRCAATASE
jgi:hypothetical protein